MSKNKNFIKTTMKNKNISIFLLQGRYYHLFVLTFFSPSLTGSAWNSFTCWSIKYNCFNRLSNYHKIIFYFILLTIFNIYFKLFINTRRLSIFYINYKNILSF